MLHCYAMARSIPPAVAYGIHYVVWRGIPYGHMTISYVCARKLTTMRKNDGTLNHVIDIELG